MPVPDGQSLPWGARWRPDAPQRAARRQAKVRETPREEAWAKVAFIAPDGPPFYLVAGSSCADEPSSSIDPPLLARLLRGARPLAS